MAQQFIYTLFSAKNTSLGSDLWYVGRTTDILTRFARHQTGTGAKCLQGRTNVVLTRLEKETPFLELVRTLELMKEHGPDLVRGGPFCNRVHSTEDLDVIKTLLDSDSFGRDKTSETKTAGGTSFQMVSTLPVLVPASDISSSDTESSERPAKRSKVGAKWTPEDLSILDSYLKTPGSISLKAIAQRLGRTTGSIESRSRTLIMNRIQNENFSRAADFYGRSEKDLREFLSCERSIFEP